MPDNKNKQTKQNHEHVPDTQVYEVRYIADKLNVSVNMVQKAMSAVGNKRQDIECFIENAKLHRPS